MSLDANKKSWGSGGLFAYRNIFSLLLIVVCPFFSLFVYYTLYHHKGSLISVAHEVLNGDFPNVFSKQFFLAGNLGAVKMISSFMLVELVLMRVVPGKKFVSTVTATGHVPVYNANGVECYLITVIVVFVLAYLKIIQPGLVYDSMISLLASMNIFALLFTLFLSIKGIYFPSTKDSGSNGDIILDFFWGTELYPRILGWDVKQFTNCRFGMMFWQVGIICYAFAQYDKKGFVSSSMLVSVILQSIYIFKFFLWETGYFCSMDIQHDRAGYYICWGCLVWVPSIYTMHTFYLVEHPYNLNLPLTAAFLLGGILSIWCNYDCDRYVK